MNEKDEQRDARSQPLKGYRCSIDDIIALYEKDVDETLIVENLKLTPEDRLKKMEDFVNTMKLMRESYLKTKGNI